MPVPEPLLAARNLAVSLAARPVLHDLSFSLPAGGCIGLIGPNGSGKTTLLRTIGGLLPYTGEFFLAGRPLSDWRPRDLAHRLAFMRQSAALAFDFAVEELVLLGRTPHLPWLGSPARADRERTRAALARVDLEGFARRSVLSLSGGELQRVFLAQALVQEADILLLDEPTAHLDVHHQFRFLELTRGLVRQGCTVLIVFHDLALAARYADHLLVLYQGRLAAAGPPRDVLSEALIRQVFRMQARVQTDAHGALQLQYLYPTHEDLHPHR